MKDMWDRDAASPADRAVKILGDGVAAELARRLGLPALTVQRWRYARRVNGGGRGGLVPAEWHRPLLDLAAELGRDFDAWDLVPGARPACAARPVEGRAAE